MNLYYNFDARHLCDALGDPVSDLPEIAFNEQPVWNITPLRADGQRMDLSAVVAWRAAIDSDFTSDTDVMCRTLPEDISVSDGTVSVPLDSNTSRFLQVVDRFETKPAYFELCGLSATGKRIFYLIFRITARMVLDPGSTDSLPDAADLFADRAYVMALLRSGCEIQFSADGENWTSSAAAAVQWRYRNRSAGGEWSDPVPIIPGQSLIPDAVGSFADRPASAPENYKYLASDRGLLYFYLNGAWSEGTAIGPRGNTGRGIESVTKVSSDGLIDTYRISFSDGTTSDFTLANGSPGQDIDWDAVGAAEERTLYDDRPAGFRFAATVTDAAAKTNTVYIWKKASAASGHWLDPLVLVRYSIPGTNAALIEPMEFYPPGGSQTVLTVPASQYPAATIAAVCIDTADGELRLPYGSATGITRIIRKSSGNFKITFGAHVPEYDTGRIYFAQGVAYVYDVTDAPADGKIYGRQSGQWAEVSSSTGPSNTATAEEIYYGYIPSEDASSLNSVADITQAMIDAAITAGTVTRVEDNALEEEITVPRYGWLFVAVPNDSSFVAKKDDGFGAQVAFSETNGVTGTSATGLKFYGEFSLVSATHTVYVSGTGSASGGTSSGSGNSSSGGNSNSGSGTSAPASQQIIELTSTAISPADNSVYYHDLESGDAFTIDLDALQDRQQWYFELDLVQPATPVSFTFPSGIVWGDGLNFDPENQPPVCNEGSKIYSIIFRLRNFRGRKYVLANLALVETVPDSEEEESEGSEE